jgi:SAM-dependent methyltransferase
MRLRNALLRWNYSLSSKSRQIKFDLFWSLMRPRPGCSVLNLGATAPHLGEVLGGGVNRLEQPEQDQRWRDLRVVGCNVLFHDMQQYRRQHEGKSVFAAVADGCKLPFGDKSFDIVFSNAVIEHVTIEQQKAMASEICRVGHSWYVTTPNFWYPIEMHHKLPLFQFLPQAARERIQRKFKTWPENEPINLLTYRDLKALFPDSKILKTKVTFFPETLVAYSNPQTWSGMVPDRTVPFEEDRTESVGLNTTRY